MLLNFKWKNFKSFKNESSLDMVAKRITELPEHISLVGKQNVLKIAAIYGANASGKSNIYQAFEFMSLYVLRSFNFGGGDNPDDDENKVNMQAIPYMFDEESKESPTYFEIEFSRHKDTSGKIYKYGFEIIGTKISKEFLQYKTRSAKSYKNVFNRVDKNVEFFGAVSKWKENIKMSLEPETLVISLGAKLKITHFKAIRDWFLTNEVVAFSSAIDIFFRDRTIPENFVNDLDVQKDVVKYLNTFDKSITGFEIEEIPSDKKDETRFRIDTYHGTHRIPLHEESAGTLKMFNLYPDLKEILNNGGVIFVDELNERLHPMIVKNIIEIFLDEEQNPYNAQLIFTTHDTWLLESNLFRRDEVWFVNKDAAEESSLSSLAEIVVDGVKIRKDENYVKNYFSGKYGGIPATQKIEFN